MLKFTSLILFSFLFVTASVLGQIQNGQQDIERLIVDAKKENHTKVDTKELRKIRETTKRFLKSVSDSIKDCKNSKVKFADLADFFNYMVVNDLLSGLDINKKKCRSDLGCIMGDATIDILKELDSIPSFYESLEKDYPKGHIAIKKFIKDIIEIQMGESNV